MTAGPPLESPALRENEILAAFLTWASNNGFEEEAVRGHEDAVITDHHGIVIVEAKGTTKSAGTDVDTLYGQLLRRMHQHHPISTRYAAVVPDTALDAALRVDDRVREQLRIDVYSVGPDGTVNRQWASPRQ